MREKNLDLPWNSLQTRPEASFKYLLNLYTRCRFEIVSEKNPDCYQEYYNHNWRYRNVR